MRSLRPFALLAFLLLAIGLRPCPAAVPGFQPFLDQHCIDCHDADVKKGGLDLTSLPTDGEDAAAHKKWVRVFDRVAAGEMPPPKKARPAAEDLKSFTAALGADLHRQHASQKGTVLRRLNRREYQNTIHDLLGVSVNVMDALPEDGRSHGFDTVGDALSISGIQMQRYIEAAETALNAALQVESKPESTKERYTLDSDRNQQNYGKHWLKTKDGATVVFNEGGFPSTQIPGLRAKHPGTYRLRITGYGYQLNEPAVFALITGSFDRGGDSSIHSFHELPAGQSGFVEVTVHLRQGDGVKISPQGLNGPDGHSPVKDGPANYPGEGLALQGIEIEGPVIDSWPPRAQSLLLGSATLREVPPDKPWVRQQRGYKPVFVADVADPQSEARRALHAFCTAAFRRPVADTEIAPFHALFLAEFARGGNYLTAIRTAAIAVLCSPEFLFLKEQPGRLTDHQLASRLAYFLTRSAPDAALLRLASTAGIADPKALREQTERLLASPAFDRFVTDFTDGWLNLREIEFTTPDKILYPEYDELLLHSMLRETRAFFTELVRANQGVANLIDSDFAMLNSRLARHYGIPGVTGLDLRKTALTPNSKRGGILTQASILKVSANGTSTSPVVRGVWVIERLLGIQPPPPPAGVPGVEPDIRGAKTMREILDKHRSTESCNGCHRAIDPPGFALENYDVIGGWRERFRSIGEGEQVKLTIEGRKVRYRLGPPVDASGELPSGAKFADLAGFKQLVLASEDRVAHCLAEKLLTFSTGREMGFSDRPELDRIVAASRAKKHGLRDLIHTVIQSDIFRSK